MPMNCRVSISDLKSPATTWAVLKTPPAMIQASK